MLNVCAEVSLSKLPHKLTIPSIYCPRSMLPLLKKTSLWLHKTKGYEVLGIWRFGVDSPDAQAARVVMDGAAVVDVVYRRDYKTMMEFRIEPCLSLTRIKGVSALGSHFLVCHET